MQPKINSLKKKILGCVVTWMNLENIILSEIKVVVVQSFPTLCDPMNWTLAASLSTGSSRQEYWSGLPCPSPGDLPTLGIKPGSLALQANSFIISPGKPLPSKRQILHVTLILYIQYRRIQRGSLSGVVGNGELINGYSFSSATWKQFCRLATKEHEYT